MSLDINSLSIEQLREIATRYTQLIDHSTVPIFIQSNGILVYVNDAAVTLLGATSAAQLLGTESINYTHPDDRPVIREHIKNLYANETQGSELKEERLVRLDGRIITVVIMGNHVFYNGQPAIQGMVYDKTKDLESAHRLQEAQNRFEYIAHNIKEVFWFGIGDHKDNYKILYVNPEFEVVWGIPCATLYTDPLAWHHVILEEDRPGAIVNLDSFPADQDFFEQEYRIRRPDGEIRHILTRVTLLRKNDGIEGVVGTAVDISDRKKTEIEAQQQKQFTEKLLDTSPGITYIYELPNGPMIFASRGVQDILGIDSTKTFQHQLISSIDDGHPDDVERIKQHFNKLSHAQENETFEIEYRVLDHRQQWRWISARETVFQLDSLGAAQSVIGVALDITNRKAAEAEAQQQQQFLDKLLDASPGMTYLYDVQEQRMVFVTRGVEQITGISAEAVMADQHHNQLFDLHPDDANTLQQHFVALKQAQEGEILKIEYRIPNLQGQWRWVSARETAFQFDTEGKLKQIIGVAIDITDRREMELALQTSQQRLDVALSNGSLGVWETDTRTMQASFNRGMAEMLGYSTDEFSEILNDWFSIVHPDDHQELLAGVEQHVQQGHESYRGEFRYRAKSGDYHWILTQGKITERDEQGQPLRAAGTHLDITVRKRLEEQLRQAQKMEAIGVLAGGIAHDFNNILFAINGFAELLQMRTPKDPDTQRFTTHILQAGERGRLLTQQLLAFSRKQTIRPEAVGLNEVVQSVESLLLRLIRENIDLKLELQINLHDIFADAAQIDQILLNLVGNAQDAMPDGGVLLINTRNIILQEALESPLMTVPAGNYVSLKVSDTGHGISADNLTRVFEPFFTTKSVGAGTGLGLSTVFGIVKQHHGFLHVSSIPNKGCSFEIFFQAHKSVVLTKHHAATAPVMQLPAQHILLVEDDRLVRTITEKMLVTLGHTVTAIDNPTRALVIAQTAPQRFNLLLSDVIMPELNGKQLFVILNKRFPELRVLYMSGYPADAITKDGVLEADAHYLQKPFKLADLRAALEKVCG
ncbi:MAG: PAS domain-containing protein [Gammaproteobacteria bacterium]|nr:PAS domain-containing protein [Gammaproteobacteria bacterium]